MSDPSPLLAFSCITRRYGTGDAEVRALDGVDMTIAAAEFVAIMGPSGSGKSTAMNLLGCLDVPSEGTYRFMGTDVGSLSRDQRALLRRTYIGFVFQGFNLLPRTPAVENVELPLIYKGIPRARRRAMALDALAKVGLEGRAKHDPSELSGGQQQRVAIARAIVSRPAVIMADEPTGNLDTVTSREIMDLLTRFNVDEGITIVMVTHEPDMAEYASRVIHFRDGRIERDLSNRKVA